jgi:lauroyl/myristoyl acyltransferase
VRKRDIERLLILLYLSPIAWLLPSRFWLPACERSARLVARVIPALPRSWARSELPEGFVELPMSRREAAARAKGRQWFSFVVFLGEHRPWGWRPRIDLLGRDHLDAALDEGRGAILWVAQMTASDLIVKRGLADAGYRVAHLSRIGHGLGVTNSRLGRLLNRFQTSVESRYLLERVVMRGSPTAALRALRRHLEANHVVSITALRTATRTVEVPFLGASILVAAGPPELARATGSRLLPVFTLQTGPTSFEVRVGGPLALGEPGEDPAQTAATQFAGLLEPLVRADPFQWWSWARNLAPLPGGVRT